ncbi:MAG: IS1634 family transposase [Firmicutes bacterium]|nr:IS1634 family transposase [Bacillota bacterium]
MFLKQMRQKNGRINISFVQGYRDPITKKVTHKTIEKLGFVDEYEHLYEDPIEHFKQIAKLRTLEMQKEKQKREILLGSVYADEKLELDEDAMKLMGNLPLSSIYHELKLNQFIINRQRSLAMDYSLNDVMQLLVYTRILSPGSKRHSFAQKEKLAGSYNCEEFDVYRALDYFDRFKDDLLVHLHEQVRIHYKRRTAVVFYDVTNFYFEIDHEDNFRMKGMCKHNTRKPLVQMGLLLDEDAIPITYRLFKGNTHDSQTLMPLLRETRQSYGLGRIITVADKGLNSGDNVAFLMAKGDGFIFSQKIRGADQGLQDYVFDQSGYEDFKGVVKQVDAWVEREKNANTPAFFMKSRPYPQKFWVTHGDDKKRQIPLDVRQIVCYNELYAKRQKHKRAATIEKAQKIVDRPYRYNKADAKGALRYVKNIEYDPNTGECLDSKKKPFLDLEKIAEDEKYDGYYAIITSEIEMPPLEVVKAYHGLWEIEHSFRITKTDLQTRPIEVSLKQRINAHFLTCFISLLILRLLSRRLDEKYPPEQIINSLKEYKACHVTDNVYRVAYYDQVIQDLAEALNLTLNRRYLTTGDLRQLVADSKKEF